MGSEARRLRGAFPFLFLFPFFTAVLQACSPAGESRATDLEPVRTRLVLLGTGTPNADPERSGPAVAVVVDSVSYVVDAGPGVVRRAAAARRLGVEGLAPERLRLLFLTHLHTDHTVGLPDFIFTPAVLERNAPLDIYGPVGTRRMVEHIMAAWSEDVGVRIEGLEPAREDGYEVRVIELDPARFSEGPVYSDERVSVSAFSEHHGDWEYAFGYRFDTPELSIVISGDTVPGDAVVEACDGCDILVHEVYSDAGFARRSPEWQRYHADSHTSASELAALASRARPRLLVLYHQLFWGTPEPDLVAEIRAGYEGEVVSGNDLDIFTLSSLPPG